MPRSRILVALVALLGPIAAVSAQAELYDAVGPPTTWLTPPYITRGLTPTGDMTGDGIPDFAVASSPTAWEIRSGADGSAWTTLGGSAGVAWGWPDAESIGDVTGDGLDDLLIVEGSNVILRESSVNVAVWTQVLPDFVGPFTSPFACPELAVLDDLDGDGYPEFAVGIRAGGDAILPGVPPPPQPALPTVVEIRSGANGALIRGIAPPLPLPPAPIERRVRVGADISGDGIRDLLVAEAVGGTEVLTVYDPTTGLVLTSANLGLTLFFNFPSSFVAVDDMDGDGLADLCVGQAWNNDLGPGSGRLVFFSTATGGVLRQIAGAPFENLGFRLDAGDIDQDGVVDVVARAENSPGGPRMVVFSGADGDELWRSDAALPRLDVARFLDVDGDGQLDLVTATSGVVTGSTANYRAFRGEASPGAAASSGLPGGEDILRVNGEDGAWSRHVRVARASPLQFALDAPTGQSSPFTFAVFAYLGTAQASDVIDLGAPFGEVMFLPAPFYPAAVPVLFTLATNLSGLAGTMILAPAGPWSLTLPQGIDATISLSLQALVVDAQGMIRRSNGVVLDLR
ncbi:MAG: VCBS repeat-containing protein [Planctomycetota bacterium]